MMFENLTCAGAFTIVGLAVVTLFAFIACMFAVGLLVELIGSWRKR